MNEINHFKVFVLFSGDVAANVDHLHVKRDHLVGFSYIVIEDTWPGSCLQWRGPTWHEIKMGHVMPARQT
jgi:hypothetical protein